MDAPSPRTADATLGPWLDRLAHPTPDPGGGAAAAVVLAAGAALVGMAAGYAPEGAARADAVAAAARVRAEALAAADVDAAHSAALAEAYHLEADDPARGPMLRERMRAAAESSREVGELARTLRAPLDAVAEHVPPLLSADVAVAATLLASAVRASAVNLRSNLSSARTAGAGADELAPLARSESALRELAARFDATASAAVDRM